MGIPAVGIFNNTMRPFIELLRSLVKLLKLYTGGKYSSIRGMG